MARSFKLTWQAGSKSRAGRWRKKYKGRVYHFPGGRGKSDRDAYDAAIKEWEKLKHKIDAELPKPYETEYRRAIGEWESVLTWCRKHNDNATAEVAILKLDQLKREFGKRNPPPVRKADTFDGRFDPAVRHPDLKAHLVKIEELSRGSANIDASLERIPGYVEYRAAADKFFDHLRQSDSSNVKSHFVEPSKLQQFDLVDPLRIEQEIWADRLKVMQATTPPDKTLKSFVARFVEDKQAAVAAQELSTARVYTIQIHLDDFAKWLGHETSVMEINGETLIKYRLALLKKVELNEWSRTTAKDRLSTVRSFVRWLWQIDAIPALPRVMDSKSKVLKIGASSTEIVVFTKSEICKLLAKASGRTKLYILLMLNSGMTQKDISDLKQSEVDWKAGRIVRKRSKTRKHENVPEVCYKLWPTTLRLLKQERSGNRDARVLLNQNGNPLCHDEVTSAGKYKKNDNVKSAFHRLQRVTIIKKPLKSLKKTSATLIRGSEKYASLESLFLGHAGGTIAHRHYAQAPQKMLDDAIDWLATEYGID